MIRVFGQTDKVFSSNGDCVLRPLKAKVHKMDNGDYYLNLETSLEYVDYFIEGNIVVANTPTGDQAFRIGNVQKTKSKLTSRCNHVFYDSMNYLIADSYVVEKDCNEALYHLNMATEPQTEFTTESNVATVASFRCVRQSLYEAIQTVLERWGGHLVRDNFNIAIKASIGVDNGIIVQYKKNLKEITCDENWDNVVTKLLPVGKDGLLLNEIDPSASIYVESTTQYALPYCKTVSFDQNDIVEEDYPTPEAYKQALVNDLRAQATEYVEINSLPQINYTLKANLEKVTDIGDVVEVIDDRLGIHLLTNVIGFEYDCILEQYTEIEFGNFSNTLSGLVGNLTQSIDRTVSGQIVEATTAVNSQIAEKVTNPAKYAYSVGEYVVFNDTLCRVISQIRVGDPFLIGTNLEASTVGEELETFNDNLTTDVDNLSNLIDYLGRIVGTIRGDISDIDGDISTINGQISTIDGQIEDLNTALGGKQDALTFDNEPTDGSDNPVKSNGIYDALQLKQPKTLSSAVTINKASKTTVEDVLSALADSSFIATGLEFEYCSLLNGGYKYLSNNLVMVAMEISMTSQYTVSGTIIKGLPKPLIDDMPLGVGTDNTYHNGYVYQFGSTGRISVQSLDSNRIYTISGIYPV